MTDTPVTTSTAVKADKTVETKKKRLPKGQRTHTRRLKKEARNPTIPA